MCPVRLRQAQADFGKPFFVLVFAAGGHRCSSVLEAMPQLPSRTTAHRTALWLWMCELGRVVCEGPISALLKTPPRAVSLLTPQLLG